MESQVDEESAGSGDDGEHQDDESDDAAGSEYGTDRSEPDAEDIMNDPNYAERKPTSTTADATPEDIELLLTIKDERVPLSARKTLKAVLQPLSRYVPPEPAKSIYDKTFSELVLAITKLNTYMTETCPDQTAMGMSRVLVALVGCPTEETWKLVGHNTRSKWLLNTWAHALRVKSKSDTFPIPYDLLRDVHRAHAEMEILHQEINKAFPISGAAFQLDLYLHQVLTVTFLVERATCNYEHSFMRFLRLSVEIQMMIWKRAEVHVMNGVPRALNRNGQLEVIHHGCSTANIMFLLNNLSVESDRQEG